MKNKICWKVTSKLSNKKVKNAIGFTNSNKEFSINRVSNKINGKIESYYNLRDETGYLITTSYNYKSLQEIAESLINWKK